MNNVIYRPEGKSIIKDFENLCPWEKCELIKYLSEKCMTFEEIEKWFIEGTGYIKYDDIDFVQEVINEGREEEVLDNMDDDEISNYLFGSYSDRNVGNLEYAMENMHPDDVAEAITNLRDRDLYPILDSLKNNFTKDLKKIANYLITGERDE